MKLVRKKNVSEGGNTLKQCREIEGMRKGKGINAEIVRSGLPIFPPLPSQCDTVTEPSPMWRTAPAGAPSRLK